ncbi:LamG domain-containing protein [Mesorhizobium japonicum]|uniref:LamG domain-containing protein n=1 Tax=Mesorhizobium japonicum TaxID=2066070 RepID=UPI003B5C81DC
MIDGAIALALLGALAFSAVTPLTASAYVAKITNSVNTGATASYFSCSAAEAADKANAYFQYYLNEASGALTAVDSSNSVNTGTYRGSMTTSTATPIACPRDSGGAYSLNGTTSYVSTSRIYTNPTSFSIEAWFKTTVAAGKLVGWGNARTGASSSFDRHLYIETTGKLDFGTYSGATQVVTSPAAVNDGKWHHAVGTLSASTGMRLYLDGSLVASNASYTAAENDTGYWRVGYDSLSGWPNSGSGYFSGQLRYAAAYSIVLSQTQVQNHFAAGR